MAKSDGVENDTLTYWLTTTAVTITRPTTWFIALYTTDPTDANTGNEVDVVVDDIAYARQSITFGAAASGSIANDIAATFAAVVYGSGAAPYVVTHMAIFDAVTTGNMIYHSPLDSSKTLSVSDQANWDAGDLTITEN